MNQFSLSSSSTSNKLYLIKIIYSVHNYYLSTNSIDTQIKFFVILSRTSTKDQRWSFINFSHQISSNYYILVEYFRLSEKPAWFEKTDSHKLLE